MPGKKALIAMSGGVDSSVAACLMMQKGFECHGCTMRLNSAATEEEKSCGGNSELEDAAAACERLGISFETADFRKDFEKLIIGGFADAYLHGRTPNPCVECNRLMKFGALFEKAENDGYDIICTGHYARVVFENGKYLLKKAVDLTKDQSYFLYTLTQEKLKKICFPLGGLTKEETRKIAGENGLANAHKKESQDICFVPDGDYAAVIAKTGVSLPPEGNFISTGGEVLGKHRGIINYTVGQRRGLGIAAAFPYYVLAVGAKDNTVTLGRNEELLKKEVTAVNVSWVSGEAPEYGLRCAAKIRYRHREAAAAIYPDIQSNSVKIVFDEPQRAITPGQSAVIYDGDTVLGGGVIE